MVTDLSVFLFVFFNNVKITQTLYISLGLASLTNSKNLDS